MNFGPYVPNFWSLTYRLIQCNDIIESVQLKKEFACTFQPVVEVMPEKCEKPLEEDLSWEDKGEKIAEEIKVENETKPGNRRISVIFAHHQSCFTPSITFAYVSSQFSLLTSVNHKLLKTGLNDVVLLVLFNVVNNIVQHCYTRLQAEFRLNNLFSIVDNIEQCGQHNTVQSCFQQPSTTRNFYECNIHG